MALGNQDIEKLLREIEDDETLSPLDIYDKIEKNTIKYMVSTGNTEHLKSLLRTIQGFTTEQKIDLIGNDTIGLAAKNGYKDCLDLLLEAIKDFDNGKKIKLVSEYAIRDATENNHIECLKSLLGAIKEFNTSTKNHCLLGSFDGENKFNLINNATKKGYIKCAELLLEATKNFPAKYKFKVIKEDIIEVAASFIGNKEYVELLLDFIRDFSTDHKLQLIHNNHAKCLRHDNKDCILSILNFLAENKITTINECATNPYKKPREKTLWHYVEKHKIEAKDTHKIWQLIKDSEPEIDEINKKLLQDEKLVFEFFSSIVCFMVQKDKAIDINIIPEDKKGIVYDIHKLNRGEKYGYKHKIFQDIESLDGFKTAEKVKIVIDVLSMPDSVKYLLKLAYVQNEKIAEFTKYKSISVSKLLLQYLKDDIKLLEKLLSETKDIKALLSYPLQKIATEQKEGSSPEEQMVKTFPQDPQIGSIATFSSGENDFEGIKIDLELVGTETADNGNNL